MSRICIRVVADVNFASAQTDTTFTYQGELRENGSPANGMFDIEFKLWNAATGGNQIGNEIENDELPVVNGRFTVELDFGADAFDNTNRWLQISVNGTDLDRANLFPARLMQSKLVASLSMTPAKVGIGTATPATNCSVCKRRLTAPVLPFSGSLDLTDGSVNCRWRHGRVSGSGTIRCH